MAECGRRGKPYEFGVYVQRVRGVDPDLLAGLSGAAWDVLLAACERVTWDTGRDAWLSERTLARPLAAGGCGRGRSSIRRALAVLVARGLLVRTDTRRAPNGGLTGVYAVIVPDEPDEDRGRRQNDTGAGAKTIPGPAPEPYRGRRQNDTGAGAKTIPGAVPKRDRGRRQNDTGPLKIHDREDPGPAPAPPFVFTGELLKPPGADWPVPADFHAEMERLCPDVDVAGEYGVMADWLLKTAASRRWTRRGIRLAVRKWLRGEQRAAVEAREAAARDREPPEQRGGLGPPPR